MTRSHYLLPLFVLALGCGPTAPTTPKADDAPPGQPRAVIAGSTEINAGEVDYAKKRDFTFTIANTGGAPLDLILVKKNCSCADVEMPAGPIAPGGEGKVIVHWAPLPGKPGPFTLSADLQTNDPKTKTLHLAISAIIKPLVHVLLEGKEEGNFIDFGDDPIAPSSEKVREVQLYSTELDTFDLEATSKEPGLKVTATKLPKGTPVSEARSGWTVEVRTTDKLPPGYLRADLNLTLRKVGTEPDRTITVPVYAVVGNGAFVVGRPGRFEFRKPKITDEDSARVDVTLLGKTGKEGVEVESFAPTFLRVDKPDSLGGGKWRIIVHLPKDNADAAKFQPDGSMEGQVVLKVAGLDRPISIRVLWDPLP